MNPITMDVQGEILDLNRIVSYGTFKTTTLHMLRDDLTIPQYRALQNGAHLDADTRGYIKLIHRLAVEAQNEMNRPAAHVSAHQNHQNMLLKYQSRLNTIQADTNALATERLATEKRCEELKAQMGNLSSYRQKVTQLKESLVNMQQNIATRKAENETQKMQNEQLEAEKEVLRNRIQVTEKSNATEIIELNAQIRANADHRINALLAEYASS